MRGNQWSLIIFTVLIQLTVGLYLFSGVVHFLLRDPLNSVLFILFFRAATLLVLAGVVTGMLVSLLHLGSPKNALRAMLNLGSSWLSAEIFFMLFFGIIAGSFTVILWLGQEMTLPGKVQFWLGCGVGLTLIYCMTNVYRLATVPSWNTPFTRFSFFKTTFLLGILAAGGLLWISLMISVESIEISTAMRSFNSHFLWVVLSTTFLLGLDYTVVIFRLMTIKGDLANSGKGFSRAVARHRNSYTLRFILGALGLILFSLPLVWNPFTLDYRLFKIVLMFLSFSLILISELIDRRIFYASFDRAGL